VVDDVEESEQHRNEREPDRDSHVANAIGHDGSLVRWSDGQLTSAIEWTPKSGVGGPPEALWMPAQITFVKEPVIEPTVPPPFTEERGWNAGQPMTWYSAFAPEPARRAQTGKGSAVRYQF